MKLRSKIIMISVIPVVVFGIFIYIFAKIKVTNSMEAEVFNGLHSSVLAVRTALGEVNTAPYELNGDFLMKGDFNVTNETGIVDEVKAGTGTVTTIFYGDTRYATSVTKPGTNERVLYTQAGEKVIETVLKGGQEYSASNVDIVGSKYYTYYVPLYQAGTKDVIGMVFCGRAQADVEKEINVVTNSILISTIVAVLIAAALAIIVALAITNAITNGVGILEKVSEGDLTEEVPEALIRRKDELGVMGKCIEDLRESLVAIITELKNQSTSLYSSSDKLNVTSSEASESIGHVNQAINEISDGASSQADETQSATENVILMGNMVEDTSAQLKDLIQISEQMRQAGDRAVDTLDKLDKINRRASSAIDLIYDQTNTTNESVARIQEATALITDIAEETNLLSLNASIEAARAGEQGRGFAVVANQIQKLAEQSNESASRIASIITELLADSENSVKTMDEVRQIMEEQSEDVRKTQEAFEDVRSGIDQTTSGMGDISAKTTSLDEARVSVVDVVQNLTAIAEENAASTQQTSASANEFAALVGNIKDETVTLKQIAEVIDKSVGQFQL
ncbi:MAG: cache domain-containing protein [Lachnospiraceae bacterium]|nr:cache domain-containing protein [Lachnospiraceae bacterium]